MFEISMSIDGRTYEIIMKLPARRKEFTTIEVIFRIYDNENFKQIGYGRYPSDRVAKQDYLECPPLWQLVQEQLVWRRVDMQFV